MNLELISTKGSHKSMLIYHEDPNALHIGTQDDHCWFIPFAKGEDAFSSKEASESIFILPSKK